MPKATGKVVFTSVAACLFPLLICLIPVASCTATSDIMFGDINDDGRVSVADADLLLHHSDYNFELS